MIHWSKNPRLRAIQRHILDRHFHDTRIKETMSYDSTKNTPLNVPRDVNATGNGNAFGLTIDTGFGQFALSLTLLQAQKICDGLADSMANHTLERMARKRGYRIVTSPTAASVGPKALLLSSYTAPWRIVEYDSSAIFRTAYNKTTRELYVAFQPAKKYDVMRIHRYVEVDEKLVQRLEMATSVGAAYNELIKGKFPSISATRFPQEQG